MGNVAYMSLFNSNNQKIQGCSRVYDREGCIEIQKINYNINRAVDSQTGKSHSTRRHQPFSILKEIDRSSPELFQCCASGKLLTSARVDLYRIDDEGEEVNYFTYTLENVRVISISPMISALTDSKDMEAVSFSFENITLAFHEGNLTACDSWSQR
jgi:type VI secretion system secreted protein Hcp